MQTFQKLNKSSGILFFTGFMLSKFQYLPFPLVSAIFRFLSLGLYLSGYSTWFAASILQPGHAELKDKWYGFAKIKQQFLFSSFVGFIATVLSVAAVFVPILFPPAAWLFLIGNVIWTIGEFHKLKNPPAHDVNFSHTQQKAYISYAITTSTISLITALAATLMIAFPPATIPITVFSLLLCVGLGALALDYWLNSNFGKHKPSKTVTGNNEAANDLDLTSTSKNDLSPKPHHKKGLGFFSCCSTKIQENAIELTPLNEDHEKQGGLENVSSL